MQSEGNTQAEYTRQQLLEKLDILIAPENYLSQEGNEPISDQSILDSCLLQMRQAFPFSYTGIYIPDEDQLEFTLTHFWPSKLDTSILEDIVNRHIEGGTFSLALQQNRAIATTRESLNAPLEVLHVLATRSRVLGMFVGVVEDTNFSPDEIELKLLSIIITNCSGALERNGLAQKIAQHQNNLEQQVEQRTLQLQLAKVQAETANRTKSQFLSTMSHELRTPITAVIGFAGTISKLMKKRPVEEEAMIQAAEHAEVISRSANHLSQLINGILDVSKIEAGKMDVETIQFSAKAAIDEVCAIISPLAEEKKLTFEVNYGYPFPKLIQSDPTKLKQILLNLCSNAIKFTSEGTIRLTAGFNNTASLLICSVADEGMGIPESQFERILQPFKQADGSTSRNFGGTGLGLSISKSFAEMLGGGFTSPV